MLQRKKTILQKIIFIFIVFLIQVQSVDIILSSTMIDTTEDTYSIACNAVSLNLETEYKLSGTCSECQIVVEKGITTTNTPVLNAIEEEIKNNISEGRKIGYVYMTHHETVSGLLNLIREVGALALKYISMQHHVKTSKKLFLKILIEVFLFR